MEILNYCPLKLITFPKTKKKETKKAFFKGLRKHWTGLACELHAVFCAVGLFLVEGIVHFFNLAECCFKLRLLNAQQSLEYETFLFMPKIGN